MQTNIMSNTSSVSSSTNPSPITSRSSTPNQEKYENTLDVSNSESGKFKYAIIFLNHYLETLMQQEIPFGNKEQNKLTLEVY